MASMTKTPTQLTSGDPVRASVGHLLTRAYSLPCSTAAQAFTQLVQPTSRFQLALDALLPLLDPNTSAEARTTCFFFQLFLVAHPPRPLLARPTHSGFLHPVLTIRAAPDIHQSLQICTILYVREGEGEGRQCG